MDGTVVPTGRERNSTMPRRSARREPKVPCPYCRRDIHEESQRCPHCEQYISAEDALAGPKPLWLVAGVVVCLVLVATWIFGR